jgi:hypothetical protein
VYLPRGRDSLPLMHTMTHSHIRTLKLIARTALASLGCAFAFTLLPVPSANASDVPALKALDDKAPSLPLTASFAKTEGEDGPYVLSLKNTSDNSIKVSGKVLLSVFFHADSKSRAIPEHAVDAGQVWTIPGLAANDKVILTATGFAPLELTVP